MPDLIAIVRATQASAKALIVMAREAHAVADACYVISSNHRAFAEGRISHGALGIANRIAQANKSKAIAAHARARRRWERAQAVLAANPLPGDIPEAVAHAMHSEAGNDAPDAVAAAWLGG